MKNEFFHIIRFSVFVEQNFLIRGQSSSEAIVKVMVNNLVGVPELIHETADGNGPINALDKALRKALSGSFPEISNVRLIDYDVHRVNRGIGTESLVKVTVTSSDGKNKWVTNGISGDIIKASLIAIAKSLKKELRHAKKLQA